MNGHAHSGSRTLRAHVLVLSDKGSRGERQDKSGPALHDFLVARGVEVLGTEILPDDKSLIADRIIFLVDANTCDVLVTCGGTGVSPRDVTPEATRAVIDKELPGFGEIMRAASLEKSPHSIVSRALAGIRGDCLIINLPGSPRAATENLAAVWEAVPHTVAKLQGDMTDCAPPADQQQK
jgi:molybdenum cofactor synthesis domain-containing protein